MPAFVARDGASIAYADDGSGPPLLFLHGLNADGRLFGPQADALADRFRVIRPDFRGHGRTAAQGRPDMAVLAADIEDLCRHLDIADVTGIGWSLGAMVLWRVLLGDEAWRFAGAVVVDMTARVPNSEGWTLGLADPDLRVPPDGETLLERGRRIARAILAADRADDGLLDRIAPLLAQPDGEAVAAIGLSLFDEDFREALRAIATPTVIAHGARSQYYGAATARFVADALPDARIARFERSGHAPHIEEPDAFNALVAAFACEVGDLTTRKTQQKTGRIA